MALLSARCDQPRRRSSSRGEDSLACCSVGGGGEDAPDSQCQEPLWPTGGGGSVTEGGGCGVAKRRKEGRQSGCVAGKALGAGNRGEGACRSAASSVSRGARAAKTGEAPTIGEEER
jgi:hypothetical protein